MEIIPAIDIIEGKCVRLTQGKYGLKKVYSDDPVEVAKMFESWGLTRLHLVDLDGARANHIVNYRILEKIKKNTCLIIDFGGGLKSDNDLRIAFENGASMVTGGSIAVKNPEVFLDWLLKFGPEKIILGADHKKGKIAVNGWLKETAYDLLSFLKEYKERGIRKIICTDIDLDGTLSGPSVNVYRSILTAFPDLHLIASGGISKISDVDMLNVIGVPAVIIGKAFYEQRISESDIRKYLNNE